jgi:glutamate synthase domain-containing protein 1
MASQKVENKVKQAVNKVAHPISAGMIAGWINNQLTNNNWMVVDMRGAKFTQKSTTNMRFTATVDILTGSEFNVKVTKKVVWVLKGSKYSMSFK